MKKIIYLSALLTASALIACGGSSEENIDVEKNPLEALSKMSENMQEQAKKMEEQQKSGENKPAMHYEELMKYLPTEVSGYNKEEPNGETVQMGELSYSSAQAYFSKGDNTLNVTLLDYNSALSMYSMATAVWSTGMKIDNSDELAQSVDLGNNVKGWETFQKQTKDASLVLGVNDRFLLTIEANNQSNTNFIKEVAKKMNLSSLPAR